VCGVIALPLKAGSICLHETWTQKYPSTMFKITKQRRSHLQSDWNLGGGKGLSLPEIKSRFLIFPFLCQHEHTHRGTHTGTYTRAANIVRRTFTNYASHAGGSVCWHPQDMRRTAPCLTANPADAFAWVLQTKVQEERSNSRHNFSEW
jgi:hypothetical protein